MLPECVHRGHNYVPPEHVISEIKNLNDDAMELARIGIRLGLQDSVIAQLISQSSEDNADFTHNQIRYAIASARSKAIFNTCNPKNSSAENLIADFEKMKELGEDMSYVALIHDGIDGEFKIRTPKGQPSKVSAPLMKNTIADIRKSMQLSNSQQVLLAFAWVSGEELSMVKRFPEMFMFDVTERTNIEKRGMFLATGIDGLGKIFIGLHCFMPNAQAVSYNWIYKVAIPTLWGNETVECVEVAITDGEDALYSPLQNQSDTSSPWNGIEVYRLVNVI